MDVANNNIVHKLNKVKFNLTYEKKASLAQSILFFDLSFNDEKNRIFKISKNMRESKSAPEKKKFK